MTILDYVSKLGISLTDAEKNFLTAWEKSYLKNETFVASMPRNCGRQAILNLIHQYTGYCRGRKESVKGFADKIKLHMIKYCHGRLDQQYCAVEVIDYIGKLMGEKDYSMDVEAEMKKHDEKVRADAIDECINYLTDYFGVSEATKYGNKTREQQEISYSTLMNYEIKQGIEELEGLKGKDTNVPATKVGEQNDSKRNKA